MKITPLTLFFFIFFTSSVFSQSGIREHNVFSEAIRIINHSNSFNGFNSFKEYYLDDWAKGYIYPNNNSTPVTKYQIRYCVRTQEFHLITPKRDTAVLSNSFAIDSIFLSNRKFINTNFESKGRLGSSYFQELVGGPLKILKRYSTVFVSGNKEIATGYHKLKPDSYRIVEKLYYQINDEYALPLSKKKNELAFMFEDNKVAEFIKNNKLKPKKMKHLIKIVEYYNTLL